MLPHRIRLRGPWELAVGGQTSRTIHLGRENLPTGPSGVAEWRRSFGQPRRLDAHERVWLCLDKPRCPALVTLNGEFLGRVSAGELWEHDVTERLLSSNQLLIEQLQGPLGWQDVFLEIRALAYLEQVIVIRGDVGSGNCEIRGTIRGPEGLSLELYVLAERECLTHRMIQLTATITPFSMSIPVERHPADSSASRWRVELVSGSIPWHVTEVTPA
ncbi:MAG: hypothetical protein N2039_02560 [Gemmataceae bacterium]|nr:hypothetical protein [Gemmataceae bacterium]